MELMGNHLGNFINTVIRNTEHPSDVPYGRTSRHCAEGYYLSHTVGAVFFGHVIDYLLPSYKAKIYVKIRHADALGIQKPFKNQRIFYRIYSGNPYTVSRKARRSRASSRADGDTALFSKIHKIPNDKIVVDIPHFFDYRQLVFESVDDYFIRILSVLFP